MKTINKDLFGFLTDMAEDPKRFIRMSVVTVLRNLSIVHRQNLLEDAFVKIKSNLTRQKNRIAASADLLGFV
jgi:hypothetical protein